MPNAIFQLDESQVLGDHESRLRRLESCLAAPLLAKGAVSQLGQTQYAGNFTYATSLSYTNPLALTFTVPDTFGTGTGTVLGFIVGSYVGNAGAGTNYVYTSGTIDGNPASVAAAFAASTVGSGYANFCFPLVGQALTKGTHNLYLWYKMDTGSYTITFSYPTFYAFLIGA